MSTETSGPGAPGGVRQLRVVLEVPDFDAALAFYRDVLGLAQEVVYPGEGADGRVALLEAGRATLELVNRAQSRRIEELEVGGARPPAIRLAFEVSDTGVATDALVAAGARLLAAPIETPWRSLNARLDAPGDVQLTLFQHLGDEHA